jgi:hypothetical protein
MVLATRSVEQILGMKRYWSLARKMDEDVYRVRKKVLYGEIAQVTAKVEEIDTTTEHAGLVLAGYFAQALGLIRQLEEVPLEQKQQKGRTPQSKLIEMLVGILNGIEYLQDLNLGAQPIVKDEAVARAWGQASLAHYSGVSRTLEAADEKTLRAVMEILRQISQPFIDRAVVETIRKEGGLIADVDLTGRKVSPTSRDYPEATFGWMDDDVHKGYQAAITSLSCELWQRLQVALRRYPGRTHSAECLQAAVQELEQILKVRPQRRVALVEKRRQALQTEEQLLQARLEQLGGEEQAFWALLAQENRARPSLFSEITRLEHAYRAQGWQEKPHSSLAKARLALAASEKRGRRTWRRLNQTQVLRTHLEHKLQTLQDQQTQLEQWLDQLQTDNLTNPHPIPFALRIDAGFSTGPNLSWLIEMGYLVLTKAHHANSAHRLLKTLTPTASWTRVGFNAEAIAMGDYFQHDCPYPLQAMLVRYSLPTEVRYTTLFYYADTPAPPLPIWFRLYNARQIIEAGIKEEKSVFTLKRHLVRSPIGMQLQEQFALFAANFLRWAATWARSILRQANRNFLTVLGQPKSLVRIFSRTRARWVRNALGNMLLLDPHGPFADTILCLSGQVVFQLALPLFKFSPP